MSRSDRRLGRSHSPEGLLIGKGDRGIHVVDVLDREVIAELQDRLTVLLAQDPQARVAAIVRGVGIQDSRFTRKIKRVIDACVAVGERLPQGTSWDGSDVAGRGAMG